jgi:hypothetical protein
MAVQARAGRAAPAGDRRDPGPAAHCYLFHVTPHPYESTRPGQGNPIAPAGHSCIAVTGFTYPTRVLTITLRIRQVSGRVGQRASSWAGPSRRRVPRSRPVTRRPVPGRWRPGACRRPRGPPPRTQPDWCSEGGIRTRLSYFWEGIRGGITRDVIGGAGVRRTRW